MSDDDELREPHRAEEVDPTADVFGWFGQPMPLPALPYGAVRRTPVYPDPLIPERILVHIDDAALISLRDAERATTRVALMITLREFRGCAWWPNAQSVATLTKVFGPVSLGWRGKTIPLVAVDRRLNNGGLVRRFLTVPEDEWLDALLKFPRHEEWP
jgi:hypothetical protein